MKSILDSPFQRLAGWAGIGFLVLLFIQNVVLLSGSPLNDASIGEVTTFYSENATRIGVAAGLVPVNLFFLAVFLIGFVTMARTHRPESSDWGVLGLIGFALMAATFVVVSLIQISLAVLAKNGTDLAVLEALWTLHSAAFAMNFAGLGLTLLSLSQVSRVAAFAPGWINILAVAGAVCAIVGAGLAMPFVEGSSAGLIGFLGFIVWLLWLGVNAALTIRRSVGTAQIRENPSMIPS